MSLAAKIGKELQDIVKEEVGECKPLIVFGNACNEFGGCKLGSELHPAVIPESPENHLAKTELNEDATRLNKISIGNYLVQKIARSIKI